MNHLRHRYSIVATSVLVASGVLLSAIPAAASNIDEKQAEALRLESTIESTRARIAALAVEYEATFAEVKRAQTAVADARAHVDSARMETRRLTAVLAEPKGATAQALGGGGSSIFTGLTKNSKADSRIALAAGTPTANVAEQLARAREQLAVEVTVFETAKRGMQSAKRRIARQRTQLEAFDKLLITQLTKTRDDLDVLIRQHEAHKAFTAFAAGIAKREQILHPRATPASSATYTAAGFVRPPAPSEGARAAIDYAFAQIGKPYRYAATGPNAFDCSGLTMMAWRAGGLNLPHYSGAQFKMFPRVPLNELQPGDLVVRGPGGSAHVALYVGDGMQVSATSTGDVVKLQPVPYNQLSGAVRPG